MSCVAQAYLHQAQLQLAKPPFLTRFIERVSLIYCLPLKGPKQNDILGGEWLGVDHTETETSRGIRVAGTSYQDMDPTIQELTHLGFRRCSADQAQTWHIRCETQGTEYFLIWFKNLLLILLSAGLYYPWAFIHKKRYLYQKTYLIKQAFYFRDKPNTLLIGLYLKFIAMLTILGGCYLYIFFQNISNIILIPIILAISLYPALYFKCTQLYLSHIGWHNLPFGLSGTLGGAYKSLTLLLVLATLGGIFSAAALVHPIDSEYNWLSTTLIGLMMLGMPLFYWQSKRYQHTNFLLWRLRTQWKTDLGMVYISFLKALCLWLCLNSLTVLVTTLLKSPFSSIKAPLNISNLEYLSGYHILLLSLILINTLVTKDFLMASLQNLAWTKTGNRHIRFKSELKLGFYLQLKLFNYVAIILTLGLYWPWATLASYKTRLKNIFVISRITPENLQTTTQSPPMASQEAASLGLDIGW